MPLVPFPSLPALQFFWMWRIIGIVKRKFSAPTPRSTAAAKKLDAGEETRGTRGWNREVVKRQVRGEGKEEEAKHQCTHMRLYVKL